jgi:cytochrome c551/c552
MRRLFDFRCTFCNTVAEHYIDSCIQTTECLSCHAPAHRIISPVRCKLDHSFPGEQLKWIKRHEQGAKVSAE